METYKDKLKAWLGETPQPVFAESIGKSQSAVSRYLSGARFPDADTAREIERATAGAVPFEFWRAEAVQHRLGIEA